MKQLLLVSRWWEKVLKNIRTKIQNNEEYIMIPCYRINWSSQIGFRFIYQNMKQKLEKKVGKLHVGYHTQKNNQINKH